MGLSLTVLSFDEKLPSLKEIQTQFNKQTGLHLKIIANVNLLELLSNSKNVIEKLSQDIASYEKLNKTKLIDNNWEKSQELIRGEYQKINFINEFQFYTEGFYGVDFLVKDKKIEIEFLVGKNYFAISLVKVLYDLGGRFENIKGESVTNNKLSKTWEKLKHWNDYKWYNRPKK